MKKKDFEEEEFCSSASPDIWRGSSYLKKGGVWKGRKERKKKSKKKKQPQEKRKRKPEQNQHGHCQQPQKANKQVLQVLLIDSKCIDYFKKE